MKKFFIIFVCVFHYTHSTIKLKTNFTIIAYKIQKDINPLENLTNELNINYKNNAKKAQDANSQLNSIIRNLEIKYNTIKNDETINEQVFLEATTIMQDFVNKKLNFLNSLPNDIKNDKGIQNMFNTLIENTNETKNEVDKFEKELKNFIVAGYKPTESESESEIKKQTQSSSSSSNSNSHIVSACIAIFILIPIIYVFYLVCRESPNNEQNNQNNQGTTIITRRTTYWY